MTDTCPQCGEPYKQKMVRPGLWTYRGYRLHQYKSSSASYEWKIRLGHRRIGSRRVFVVMKEAVRYIDELF